MDELGRASISLLRARAWTLGGGGGGYGVIPGNWTIHWGVFSLLSSAVGPLVIDAATVSYVDSDDS